MSDTPLRLAPRLPIRAGATALLIVDMQYHDAAEGRGFNLAWNLLVPGSMSYMNRRIEKAVIPNIRELLAFARRERALLPVFTVYGSSHRDLRDMPMTIRERVSQLQERSGINDIFWTRNPDFAIRQEIAPREGELIVRKRTFGAFVRTKLHGLLRERGIENVVLCGVSTSCCVENTARGAADHGYRVILIDQATADYTPQAQRASLQNFAMNFGDVVSTGQELISRLT